jgi:predicted nucleic acid-binding protein
MSTVIVDASIVLKWVLQEPDSHIAEALLAEWIDKETVILAPALLVYELNNSLYRKARKGEITFEEVELSLRKILLTGLELDFSEDPNLSLKAVELAKRFDLPATYDSHYLALAQREGCELWTTDIKLLRALRGQLSWVRRLEDYQQDNL